MVGLAGWTVYVWRALRRSLHMLQQEGYLTARFLRWWAARPTRVTPPAQLATAALGSAAALGAIVAPASGAVALSVWGAAGWWIALEAGFPTAKKPLVMTARASRLAGGVVGLLGIAGWALAGPGRGRTCCSVRPPTLAAAISATALGAPIVVAAANLALYPVEEAFRRYYLGVARRRLREVAPLVVAVAGSYGKTSTKEMLGTILASRFEVLKPPGSHNTPMGIARVLREQLRPEHELFVAELGDHVVGDISFLCRLLQPKVGVLTTVGPEHLERFGSMERVIASKAELLEALPADGVAVLNQDDPAARELAGRTRAGRVVRYGIKRNDVEVRARDIQVTREGLTLVVEAGGQEAQFRVGLLGEHNVSNLLAATAAALALGMSLAEVAAAAARVQPVEHRLQPIHAPSGVLVIDDAFNSNPRGAASALDVLGRLPGGQKVLVTPGMIELGERQDEENRAFGRRAAAVCDRVILVGPVQSRSVAEGLREAGFPADRAHAVWDLSEATALLGTLIGPGDVVLFENDLPDTYAE